MTSERWEELVERMLAVGESTSATPGDGAKRGFGSTSLKTGGRMFAMLAHDRLVVKLPAKRVEELVAGGMGRRFDPGHGKLQREWLDVWRRPRNLGRACHRSRGVRGVAPGVGQGWSQESFFPQFEHVDSVTRFPTPQLGQRRMPSVEAANGDSGGSVAAAAFRRRIAPTAITPTTAATTSRTRNVV